MRVLNHISIKMFRKFFSDLPPLIKLLLVILITFFVFVVFLIIGIIIAIPIFDIQLENFLSLFNSDGDINFIKYIQVIQGFALFIIPSFLIAFLFSKKGFEYLQLTKKPKQISILLIVFIVISSLPLINFLAEFNANMNLPAALSGIENYMKEAEESAKVLTEKLLKVETTGGLFFNLFMIAVIPAIGEELLFRGIIQKLFTQSFKNHHVGIIISAIIFSAFHFQFYGFIPRMFLGMLFGYMLVWSKSLWLPIIAHFTNNAIAVIVYYYITKGNIPAETENFGSNNNTSIFALVSLLIMGSLLFLLFKIERSKRKIQM